MEIRLAVHRKIAVTAEGDKDIRAVICDKARK